MEIFQFLYGAIGSCDWEGLVLKPRCFNSYMVRLEEGLYVYIYIKNKVSIPIWCDWKSYEKTPRYTSWLCFNSYMVRLEGYFQLERLSYKVVSIPIWCDWKTLPASAAIGRGADWGLRRCKSSFNSYMVRLEARGDCFSNTRNQVSIPIWCDWKPEFRKLRVPKIACFNSYMVRLEVTMEGTFL